MKKTTKNFFKGIIVVISFAAVLFAVNRIFMLKSEDGYEQMQSFYKQKKDTVDVLFIGSSRVYCDIDTGVLWDDFGIASFDLGGAEATTWSSYYFMKEALKTQKPKVIVYDASMIGYRHEMLYQYEGWTITNNYGMKWNKNRLDQLRLNCETDDEYKKLLIPLSVMHSRYNELGQNDFFDENNNISYKGFDYRDTVAPFDQPEVSQITEEYDVYEKHITYLKKMFALADDYNIPFIVIIAPAVIPDNEAMIFNTVQRICEESGISYIDFNKKYDEIGLQFGTDMADNSHLNFSGSKKYCDYIGNYLKANYDIPDRRGDTRFASWERDAAINRQNRRKYEIEHTEDEDTFNQLVNDNVYVVIRDVEGPVQVTNGENVIFNGSYKGEFKVDGVRMIFDNESGFGTLYIDKEPYGLENGTTIVYDTVLKKVVSVRKNG